MSCTLLLPIIVRPSIVCLLDNVAARKCKNNIEHSIRMPREGDQMVAARPPLARELVLHGTFAGTRPAHGHFDCPVCVIQLFVQSHRYGGSIIGWVFNQVHKCAHFRRKSADFVRDRSSGRVGQGVVAQLRHEA